MVDYKFRPLNHSWGIIEHNIEDCVDLFYNWRESIGLNFSIEKWSSTFDALSDIKYLSLPPRVVLFARNSNGTTSVFDNSIFGGDLSFLPHLSGLLSCNSFHIYLQTKRFADYGVNYCVGFSMFHGSQPIRAVKCYEDVGRLHFAISGEAQNFETNDSYNLSNNINKITSSKVIEYFHGMGFDIMEDKFYMDSYIFSERKPLFAKERRFDISIYRKEHDYSSGE